MYLALVSEVSERIISCCLRYGIEVEINEIVPEQLKGKGLLLEEYEPKWSAVVMRSTGEGGCNSA